MSITSFGTLKTALADWTTSPILTTWLPDFVTIAETIFNYGEGDPDDPAYIAPLRCIQMEVPTSLTVDANFTAALPDDFLEVRRVLTTASTPRTMKYVTPEWYSEAYPSGDTSDFEFYTILGNNLISGTDVTLTYYQLIPTLIGQSAGDDATNWLLSAAPNAYLFGGLYAAAIFQHDADEAGGYRGLLKASIAGFRRTNAFARADRPTLRASATAF